MPHKQAVKDKDGKVTGYIGMYDESNRLCYDKIDTRGLAPLRLPQISADAAQKFLIY